MSEPIISVSGLRGVVGKSLTPGVAMAYACAFACGAKPGPIVLARDGRSTGKFLADAVRAALCGIGRDVIDAGVAATPTVGVLARHLKAAGGIQISASHNPPEYNGLKLFSYEGRIVPAVDGEKVIERYRALAPAWATYDQIGTVTACDDTTSEHLRLILATVDSERIRSKKYSVLLDSNHGAGAILGRKLLEALGCRLYILGEGADGHFEHPPEPTAENLAGVAAQVSRMECDLGFCQDPDADRLAIIDATGNYLGEEYTLAITVAHRLSQQPGPIVTNCSTSRMSQDLAQRSGVACQLSAVGEANVVDVMLSSKAVLGGEGNGGVIDPRVVLVRDSFTGMAAILDAMAARELSVAQLAGELPRYAIVKTKAPVEPGRTQAAMDALARQFSDAKASRLDGLRLDWPDGWLLVRPSNTEPIVRAIAEATTEARAQEWCAVAQRVLAAG